MCASRRLAAHFAFAIAVIAAPTTHAHLAPQAGRMPLIENGAIVGGGTTWGLLLPDGDGWVRACEESFSTAPASFWRRAGDGTVLIGGQEGLLTTSDGGCTYDVVPALKDVAVSSYCEPQRDHLFITSSSFGIENNVRESFDGGKTWTPTGLHEAGVLFLDVQATDDARSITVTGFSTASSDAPLVLRTSIDGGATWTTPDLDLSAFSFIRALGIDVDGESAIIAGLTKESHGRLMKLAPGGTSLTTLGDFDLEVTHYASLDGARYALSRPGRVFRERPGETTFTEKVAPNAPNECLFAVRGEPGLWGCAVQGSPAQFLRSDDEGSTWTAQVGFEDIDYRVCPAGSRGAVTCAFYFQDGGPSPIDDAGPEGDITRLPVANKGDSRALCACATSSGDTAASMLGAAAIGVLAGLLSERRRRRPRGGA